MISVIATVYNEAGNIEKLLDSLMRQALPADEIVIVDAGSTDQTVAIIQSYQDKLPIKILTESGCNISQGRNIAIEAAKAEIICVTDAGLQLDERWVEALATPLIEKPSLQVVAGFFWPTPQNAFELSMGAAVGRLVDEIDPETFLPGSRSVAYRKEAWLAVGKYPEWLDFGEDLVFIMRLKMRFHVFHFAPDAIVYFETRPSLKSFYKQYYHYARGDGKANIWLERHLLRYVTYGVLIPSILWAMLQIHPLFIIGFFIGGVIYLRQPYRRLKVMGQSRSFLENVQAMIVLPVIRATGDIAKMIGYIEGRIWRAQHDVPDWRQV